MAAKVWSAAADGNWDVDANWDGGTKPAAGDTITFDATSVKNCTCDVVPSIGSLTITSAYTGTFNDGGVGLTVTGAIVIFNTGAATGTFTSSGSWSCSTSWTFGNAGTVNMSGTLTFTSTATITSGTKSFYNITVNSGANTITFGDSTTISNDFTVTDGKTTWSGYTLTVGRYCDIDGSRDHNFGNGVTCTGNSGRFHVGSTVGTVTATSCVVTMNGTTGMTLDDDKSLLLKQLVLGASAIVTSSGTTTSEFRSPVGGSFPLVMGANSSFTANRQFNLTVADNTAFMSLGANVVLNGTANIWFSVLTNNKTGTIPAFAHTGSGTLIFSESSGNNITLSLSGNISTTGNFRIYSWSGANNTTFNSNNYNITASTMTFGTANALSTMAINLGSSTISCSSFLTTTYNGGPTTINASSSQWTISGDFDLGTNTTWTASTEVLTFNSTTAVTAVFAGETVYDIIISKTGGGFTFSDGCACHDLTVAAANNQAVSWTGQVITASGDIEIDGTGTLNMGNGVTMNGASGVLHIGSTVGAMTAGSCAITMNGTTGMTLDIDFITTFKSLTIGAAAIVTNSGAINSTFNNAGTCLTMGNNSSFTLNRGFNLYATAACQIVTIGTGCTFNGTSNMLIAPYAVGANITFSAFSYTGSGTIEISSQVNAAGTIDFLGNFSSTGPVYIHRSTTTNATTFGTGNFSFTATAIRFGSSNATGTIVYNLGTSVITCSSFQTTTYNTGASTINASTSVWTCTGDFDLGTNTTWVATGETISFTGATACTLTTAGEYFYNLVVNKTALGVTLSDGCWCNNFTVAAGTFSTAGFSMTLTGSGSWGGTGALTISGVMTFTGNGTTAQIITSGVKTTAASTWVFQGTAHLLDLCADASITINDLVTRGAGQTIVFMPRGAGKVLTITIYVLNDWGNANPTLWRSFIPGVRAYIAAPAGVTAVGMNVMDNDNSAGALIGIGANCTNSGNNVNWDFPASGSGMSARSKFW